MSTTRNQKIDLKACDVLLVVMDTVAPIPNVKLKLNDVADDVVWTLRARQSAGRRNLQYFFPIDIYAAASFQCTVSIDNREFRTLSVSVTEPHPAVMLSSSVFATPTARFLISSEQQNPLVPIPYISDDVATMPIYNFSVQVNREAVLLHGEFPQLWWREHESTTEFILQRANTNGKFDGTLTRGVTYKMWYVYVQRGKKSREVLLIPQS